MLTPYIGCGLLEDLPKRLQTNHLLPTICKLAERGDHKGAVMVAVVNSHKPNVELELALSLVGLSPNGEIVWNEVAWRDGLAPGYLVVGTYHSRWGDTPLKMLGRLRAFESNINPIVWVDGHWSEPRVASITRRI